MKKTLLLSLLLTISVISLQAQFPVGTSTITYTDASRTRDIDVQVYYPATSAGSNTPFATGTFPLIVLGHGFSMTGLVYTYFANAVVAEGYILACPRTEEALGSADHGEFGLDLAFINTKIKSEGTNNASIFYNHILGTSAIMGHSMGGGCTFLAGQNNTNIDCMISFAANETTPSAITAAALCTVPNLVVSGEVDCVSDPATNQVLMYNAVYSTCKSYISIKDGSHCNFGDYSFWCTFGESTCMPTPPLTDAEQQDVAVDFSLLYLNWHLKGDATAQAAFVDSLSSSRLATYQHTCPSVNVEEMNANNNFIFPNPATDLLNVSFANAAEEIYVMDVAGKILMTIPNTFNYQQIDISDLQPGYYLIRSGRTAGRFLKVD
ncbi:MAG: T9SS type A sorting domain-containing protein [Bacteroidota bacterium]